MQIYSIYSIYAIGGRQMGEETPETPKPQIIDERSAIERNKAWLIITALLVIGVIVFLMLRQPAPAPSPSTLPNMVGAC